MEGARVDGPFRGVDVLPTALDLVGAWSTADAASFEGRSLAPLLRGGSVAPPVPPALSEQLLFGAEDDCAVTLWPWHLIVSGSERRLFDLSADPEERTDLTERFPERAAELERIARELRARAAGRRRGTSARMQVDAAAEQALSALGYGGGEGD
jgi:arylsulfatase A-like enzyme